MELLFAFGFIVLGSALECAFESLVDKIKIGVKK